MSADFEPEVLRLREELGSTDRYLRAQAAIELGQRRDVASLPEVARLLNDPDDLVAVAALYGCVRLGADDVSVERAAESLGSSDEEVMQAAVQALCALGEAAVPKLSALLDEMPSYAVEIVHVLEDIGGEAALAVVRQVAARPDPPGVAQAAREVLESWSQ